MARQGGGHNGHMVVQTSIATILEFPSGRPREPWVPRHARQPTVDDFEFYWLNPIQPLWNLTGRPPPALWPSYCYGPQRAGRQAWVIYGEGRMRPGSVSSPSAIERYGTDAKPFEGSDEITADCPASKREI